jgi:hypothetical protein
MRSILSIGFFGVFLLAGSIFPSMGQELTFADHVVINEVDINPPGNDSLTASEWVELYNPTSNDIDIGGWEIASTTVLRKTMTISEGTIIPANGFLAYSYQKVWFTDVSEVVQLRDVNGIVIDQTPSISDLKNDFKSWQRIYDGLDTDTSSDWEFNFSHPGSTNGKFINEDEVDVTTVTLSTNKAFYTFDETATISGQVSEQLFIEKPFFQAEQIKINIFGPNGYDKDINLYPDLNLKYKTDISLRKVLGINEGAYYVSVQYGDASVSAQFEVGDELILTEEVLDTELSITTDKDSYIPGQTAKIIAHTNEIIPYTGMKFTVTNPNGKQIFDGTLYPKPNGEFSTSIFMTTVKPVYGFHKIVAEYGTHSTVSSFDLTEDLKEDKIISLKTDKKAYALGETVYITGRLNNLWIFALDFEIQQTGIGSLDTHVLDRLKILDSVRLEGDSTFSYEFEIPNNPKRYGDYKVTASKEVGSETIFFHIVENPDEYVETTIPFTVLTDKLTYDVGDPITISGKINAIQSSSSFQTPTVDIRIKPIDGGTIFSNVHKPSSSEPDVVLYTLTAVPDQVGNYKVEDKLYKAIYSPGTFEVRATYAEGLYFDSQTFTVIDPLNIESMIASTDKEVYGLGETVKITGIVPKGGAGNPSITITVTKPDGDTNKYGTNVDNGKFSWSWTTPISEKPQTIQNKRVLFSSNYGIYKISLNHQENAPIIIFFKVSPNPDEDSLNVKPLTITTEFPVYKAGEKLKVFGTSLKRVQGTQGLVVPDRVEIAVKSPSNKVIFESSVYSDAGGNFASTFDMPVTIFKEGTYKVNAIYQGIRAENFFQVDNDFFQGETDKLSLVIGTDKEEYYPGDVALIKARPTKMIFVETVEVGIPTEEQTKINCGSFVCGKGVPITTLRPDGTGTINYKHTFQNNVKLGPHIITFDTEFGTFTKKIELIEKPPTPEPITFGERIIEKINRITESSVQIIVNEKNIDEKTLAPRVIQGSLFSPARGEESNVNIKITTIDGICVIGPDSDCMVQESTRSPGEIYKIVEIDGMQFKIRYTGPDVTLEKFTILPEASNTVIPDSTWNIEVVKGEQTSHVYYKVNYAVIE